MARWFGPKRIGYGVSPRSWQGWAATAAFLALFIGSHFIPVHEWGLRHWIRPLLGVAVLVIFLGVVWLKYEPDPDPDPDPDPKA